MKTLNANEMRNINGGESMTCQYCHRTFNDTTYGFWIFKWTKTGQQSWAQHLTQYGSSCIYAKKK